MVETKRKIEHKVPLVGHLPEPDARVFDNSEKDKPIRKIQRLDVKFGEVNAKNFE